MPRQKIILKGIGASPGMVEGRIKIINLPEEINSANQDEIIVASFLTPGFVSAIKGGKNILGIITDKGGLTCHAAIVARQLKIPYIAGAIGATKRLKNKAKVVMDSQRGLVYEGTQQA